MNKNTMTAALNMGKKSKSAILAALFMLVMQQAYSQAQQSIPDYLKERFMKFVREVPREELFVHADRAEYMAGETLWFNLYLIDRQSLKPSMHSNIAYFELLTDEFRPVLQKRVLLVGGSGPGQLVLPDTLSSGIYFIRAYTSWMRNFMPENCYIEEVTVYNRSGNGVIMTGQLTGKIIRKENAGALAGEDGLTLRINNSKPDILEILVDADHAFRTENNGLFYLFIQTRGNINRVSAEKLTDTTASIPVQKSLLGPGIHQITLFNAKGKPVVEKYAYTPGAKNNRIILHAADSVGLRDKIKLEILTDDRDSALLNTANLSISIAPLTSDQQITDLSDYLIWGTEFGVLPDNSLHDLISRGMPPEAIDSMLCFLHSNWINWNTIVTGDIPVFKYPAEKVEHFLYGKIISNEPQASWAGELVVLCIPGKQAQFQYAKMDEQGKFRFGLPIHQEAEDLILMPDEVYANDKVMIISSFADQIQRTSLPENPVRKQVPPGISKLSVNHQVQKIYGISDLGDTLGPFIQRPKPKRFYGKPDIGLIMADYIKLPVMEEVFYELLPNVSMKKRKNGHEITITERINNTLQVTTPCLMIDGVIIRDASLIAGMDPGLVERIDVIREKYFVGRYTFPGILNIITRTGDFTSVSLPDYMTRLSYRVTDPVRSFNSPDYSTVELKNSRIPDYRNTLYWNPVIKPGKDGKIRIECWSSDNQSDYLINIEGLMPDGEAFSLKKIITVK